MDGLDSQEDQQSYHLPKVQGAAAMTHEEFMKFRQGYMTHNQFGNKNLKFADRKGSHTSNGQRNATSDDQLFPVETNKIESEKSYLPSDA